jgi:hypothetical protein
MSLGLSMGALRLGRGGPRHNPGAIVRDNLDFYWDGDDLADATDSTETWTDRNASADAALAGIDVTSGVLSGDTSGTKTASFPTAAIPQLDTTEDFTVLIAATADGGNSSYQRLWSCRNGISGTEPGLAITWRGNIRNIQVVTGDGSNGALAQHVLADRISVARSLVVARFEGGAALELVTYNGTDGLTKTGADVSTFGDCTSTTDPVLFREGNLGSFSFSGSCESVGQTASLLTDQQIIDYGDLVL